MSAFNARKELIMKVKAKFKKDGNIEGKFQIKHEMTTYDQAEKKTGNREDANFLTHIIASVNGKVVYEVSSSQFLTKNPIIKFKFKGSAATAKGDKLVVTHTDRKGNTETNEGKIKFPKK